VLEERRDLVLILSWNELWRWKRLFQILDNVVALDVHRSIVHQHWNQPTRIDAEKPRVEILVGLQVNEMRFPLDALEV
jgi:hypothetical protein